MTPPPRENIGPYEVLSPLGKGGMGEVFRARDTRLDRDVAIKVLPESMARDPERILRFEREAKLLASLNHPNIAHIYGFESSNHTKFLVLEYVEGETLAARLKRGALPLDEALAVCKQISEAVEAAHENGVIHRDLKPGNVMLTPDGKVKVLDFGLARAMADDPSTTGVPTDSPTETARSPAITDDFTRPGIVLGTAAYMSPEQARGRPVDKRTDIWSFGVILYECLTGQMLFRGETTTDSIGAVLHKEVELGRLPPEAQPALRHVLSRCLAREKARRYRDIGDVRIELELAASGGSELGVAPTFPEAPSSALRFALGGLVLGAVAVAITAWSLWPGAKPKVVQRFDLGVPGSAVDAPASPVISPDGSKVVYRQRDRLWVRELSRFAARELPGTEGAIEPFWSPDESWIGFAQGRYLMKTPADGGRPERITTMSAAMTPAGGGAWLADGTIIFTSGSSELYSVSSGGGRPEIWLPHAADEEDFHDVALLPDGRGVVFVSHTRVGPWKICVADGAKRAEVIDAGAPRAVHDPVYSEPGFIVFEQRAPSAGLWAVPFNADAFRTTGKPFLIAGDATRPSVSSDGALAYLRNSAQQHYVLTWLPLAGGPGEPVGEAMSVVGYPALSPDGLRIAYVGGDDSYDLLVYDIASGRRTVIAPGIEGRGFLEPSWSPDGARIAVSLESDDAHRISFFSADGSGKAGEDLDGRWASFDDTWASAAVERIGPEGHGGDIWYVPLNGAEEARPLIATRADEDWARVSPDGHWLCYRSDGLGTREFFLTRYPSGEGRWQVTNGGGDRLEWGPKADRIYYNRSNDWALTEVALDMDDGVKLGAPRRLWNREENGFLAFLGFEVPPPGDRVLGVTIQKAGDVTPSIGIVLNWYQEFRRQ